MVAPEPFTLTLEPFAMISPPLASLKILDFTTLLPGPFATMMLADLGADVLRIEAPHRPDLTRLMPPYDGDVSAWHAVLNRNKRSLALDLKRPEAATIIHRLLTADVGGYDILVEQFRPGVMARLGLGYETLRAINPRLIYVAITGYGQTGPYRDRAGHDINYLALSGMMSHSGRRDCGPTPLGVQVADIGGGTFGGLIGLLTAVIQRQLTGSGQFIDISMFDMAIAWQSHVISHYLVGNEVPAWESWALNGGGPYDFYETADGGYLSVGSLEPKFWRGFCAAIDRPELFGPGLQPDTAVQQQVKAEIRATLRQKSLAQWTTIFNQADVCVEPVLTVPEALAHPQVAARGLVTAVPKPDGTTQPQIGSPLKFSGGMPTYRHIGVPLGAHTAEVLAALGYDESAQQTLRQNGLFG